MTVNRVSFLFSFQKQNVIFCARFRLGQNILTTVLCTLPIILVVAFLNYFMLLEKMDAIILYQLNFYEFKQLRVSLILFFS